MRQEREKAADLIIAMIDHVDREFERFGYVLPAREALQSREVTGSLLKVATFSLNMHAVNTPGEPPVNVPVAVPDVLMAAGVHYAMEVAPFIGSRGRDATVAHVDDLLAHVKRIEEAHGEIVIDRGLLDLVCTRLESAPAPEGGAPIPGEGEQQ